MKTPQQIAEALARKCSEYLNEGIPDKRQYDVDYVTKQILLSIPLVELLECRLALLMIKESCSDTTGYVSCILESKEIASAALIKIDPKLKQQGVIE